MKNIIFLLFVSILFVSCGGEVEQAPVSDSVAVAVDTVVVAPVADPSEVEKLKEAKEELKAKREAKEEPLEVK